MATLGCSSYLSCAPTTRHVKMKFASALLLLIVAVAVAGEKYTTKYDNVNVDDILKNERLLSNYVNCLLDKGKCSPDGQELKSHIKEALEQDCAKCTDKQKSGSKKVLKYLYEKKPEMFKPLEAKYDANGEYRKRYEKEFKKQ